MSEISSVKTASKGGEIFFACNALFFIPYKSTSIFPLHFAFNVYSKRDEICNSICILLAMASAIKSKVAEQITISDLQFCK